MLLTLYKVINDSCTLFVPDVESIDDFNDQNCVRKKGFKGQNTIISSELTQRDTARHFLKKEKVQLKRIKYLGHEISIFCVDEYGNSWQRETMKNTNTKIATVLCPQNLEGQNTVCNADWRNDH